MKKRLLAGFAICVFCGQVSAAFAALTAGDSCDALGTSMMAADQKSIVTCLRDDDDEKKLVWKSMQASSSAWEKVEIENVKPFDTACEYRVELSFGPNSSSAKQKYYPIYVASDTLFLFVYYGNWLMLNATNKHTTTWVGAAVSSIEKRC